MSSIFDELTEFFKDMLSEGIKADLEPMFSDINDKVGVIVADVGKTPMGWNGEVYSFIRDVNDNVIVSVAGLIITTVLYIELISMVMQKNNMYDTGTFEFSEYIIKMFIAVCLVDHAFESPMVVFGVVQNFVNKAVGVATTSTTTLGGRIVAMIDTLKEREMGELLMILVETSLVRIAIQCISSTITLIVYGRMLEIYVYSSVSSILFATTGNKEWSRIRANYIKGLFTLGLQSLFLMVYLGICTILIRTVQTADIHASLFSILGYALLLGLVMFKGGVVAKSIMNTH